MSVNSNRVRYERRLAVVEQLLHSHELHVSDWSRRELKALSLTEPRLGIQYLDFGVQ